MSTLAPAERVRRGAAYLAHRQRGDVVFLNSAAQDLGDWEDAAHIFLALSEQLLLNLAGVLRQEPEDVAVRMAVEAASLLPREESPDGGHS